MSSVSVTDARDDFAELVNRVAYGRERILVARRGRNLAALVPPEDVALLEMIENEIDLTSARAALRQHGGTGSPCGPHSLSLDRRTTEERHLPVHAPTGDPVLVEIVTRLVDAYRPERIYLFGSRARGNQGPDSDYDLLVIVPNDAPADHRRSGLAYRVLRGTGVAADVVVMTRDGYDARRHVPSSLPGIVEREGELVHAA